MVGLGGQSRIGIGMWGGVQRRARLLNTKSRGASIELLDDQIVFSPSSIKHQASSGWLLVRLVISVWIRWGCGVNRAGADHRTRADLEDRRSQVGQLFFFDALMVDPSSQEKGGRSKWDRKIQEHKTTQVISL